MKDKVGYFEDNLMINYNTIKMAYKYGVKRLLCVLSTCIFPEKVSFPMDESNLHGGAPHPTSEGYAYAKRMLETQCRIYNEQFKTDFVCIIPTNLYGSHDTFGERSHAIASLLEKAYKAKVEDKPFKVLGTGTPLRQFLLANDLCKLTLWDLFITEHIPMIALVPEEEYSIKELSEYIVEVLESPKGYEFDPSFADGVYKKTMGNDLLRSKLKNFKFTPLKEGLKGAVADFLIR